MYIGHDFLDSKMYRIDQIQPTLRYLVIKQIVECLNDNIICLCKKLFQTK